ncbi:YncE family protein [Flavobacterium subsaxonicum]|uniref:YncE family protein n=1 Tax=Flavobacterium subsaxonicum TaxID=426226 RepID=UPI00042548E9|nr:YncE family protein [Flavobacterium subsaxonicum]
MKYFKQLSLLLFILFCQCMVGQDKNYILALSKGSKKVVVYNYNTLDSVTAIPVEEDPHEIVTNNDGSLAYVSHPILNGAGHKISVVNLQTLRKEKTIDTKPFYTPHGLVYLNNKLWFTAQGSKSVAVYNTQKDSIEQVFGTGQDFTHLLYVTPDGNRFYTTNVESGTVSIFEKKQLPPYMPPTGVLPANAKSRLEWRQVLVDVGPGAEGFDVSPDGKELWTARPDGFIVVVDLEKQKVKATIDTHVLGLHRLKIMPDGQTVCIVSVKTGDLLYYNRQTHKLEQQMNIGKGAGIYMDKASNRMFVSCTPDNYIVVIDLNTRKVIKKLHVSRPDGVTSVRVQ